MAAVPELVTLGESMISLAPGSSGPLRYVQEYRPRLAGAESNLAIGLTKLGHSVAWFGHLGDDEFGHFVNNSIRGEGVDSSRVVFDPDHRTGVMFKEMGIGETRVTYYRENSAASHLSPDEIPDDLLDGARMLYVTGITPALSESCARAVAKALDMAESGGVAIGFDPNVRRKLWKGRDYAPLLRDMALRSRVLMLGLAEAELLFKTVRPEEVFDLVFRDGRAEAMAIKNGGEGSWVATRDTRRSIPPIQCVPVEPIGAGDAFNAGFLAGYLEGRPIEQCGRMGNYAGGLTTQVVGDIEGFPGRERMLDMLDNVEEVFR